jgi:hypothetical protein
MSWLCGKAESQNENQNEREREFWLKSKSAITYRIVCCCGSRRLLLLSRLVLLLHVRHEIRLLFVGIFLGAKDRGSVLGCTLAQICSAIVTIRVGIRVVAAGFSARATGGRASIGAIIEAHGLLAATGLGDFL